MCESGAERSCLKEFVLGSAVAGCVKLQVQWPLNNYIVHGHSDYNHVKDVMS